MSIHYLPVRLVRLIKAATVLIPLLIFWCAIVSFLDSAARQQSLEEERRNKDAVHTYLEKTSFCERLKKERENNSTLFNATVHDFCRQFEIDQKLYFSRRTSRVNPFNYSIIKRAATICDKDTFMIVLVHSLHNYQNRRQAIRNTWGGAAMKGIWPRENFKDFNVRVVFIFGQHTEATWESNLEEESRVNGDVVQGNFTESYKNMTLKSLLGLKWVLDYCPSAKYLFKCDDDMFINVPAILRVLQNSPMTRSIMGPLNRGSRVYRRGKWGLAKERYPFYYFPPYESGSGYVITADLVKPLLDTSEYVPWIFIDDVYITGILGKILGVHHVLRSGFAYWTSKAPTVCQIHDHSVLTGTRVLPEVQLDLWKQLTEGLLQCSENNTTSTILAASRV